MRDFFHIDRVNGTIEEERILWREVAAAPGKKENIFLHSRREKKMIRKEENLGYGAFDHWWLERSRRD